MQLRVLNFVVRETPLRSCATIWLLLSWAPAAMCSQQVASSLPDAPSGVRFPSAAQSPVENHLAASVTGVVTDADGALVPGAQVVLTYAGGAGSSSAVAGEDGTFGFYDVVPGEFTVVVTSQGFSQARSTGSLLPGQQFEVPPLTLKMASVETEVDAVVSKEQVAEAELRIDEKQRLVGFVPNFFVTYNWTAPPLSSKQKFRLALKNASDPGNLIIVGLLAGIQQADDDFDGYGQGAEGYGKRYGAGLANLVAGTFLGGAVLPSLFHQDPRYFYKGTGTIRERAIYAITRAVISRGDNGKWQPAWASVLGDLSAGAISNIYYPAADRNGAALTVENGLIGIGGDAIGNVLQEFVLRKFTPSVKAMKNP